MSGDFTEEDAAALSAEEQRKRLYAQQAKLLKYGHLTIGQVDDLLASNEAKIASFRKALTPSAETKAAYIGEFEFRDTTAHDMGGKIFVPWTTVKEIMAAILKRADSTTP